MKSCGATNRVDGPNSVAATKERVNRPSAGYSVPRWFGKPMLPALSTVKACATKATVLLVYATPVSSTATVIDEPAAGWMSHACSIPMTGRFHWSA